VTGASRGIGRAIALTLARQGHSLVLVSRSDGAPLDDAVEVSRAAGGSRVVGRACDVADADAIDRLFAAIAAEGVPTGLVNCAGHVDRAALADMPVAVIDRILAVNLRGTLLCCRAAVSAMREGGAIVNISSQSARFGGDRLAAYAAAKAGIEGFTLSLAREVAPGIRVNAVSPGPVLTEPLRALPADKLAAMQASLPMGRFCTPDEVANTVAWPPATGGMSALPSSPTDSRASQFSTSNMLPLARLTTLTSVDIFDTSSTCSLRNHWRNCSPW
jgi:NAD(P)-dependent dehydrogenase (short-subunit alcohol dehydrogenase family)